MARVYSVSQGRFIDKPDQPMDMGTIPQLEAVQQAQSITGKKPGFRDVFDILKPQEPSAAEESDVTNKTTLDRRLGVLESMWFPYEDKLALPKQGNKVTRILHKLGKQYEASSEYENFRTYAKTLGATLAKAAGDTGNIAMAEQAAQLQALADADVTKEEALQRFKNIRSGLGVPKEDEYYQALRQMPPQVQGQTSGQSTIPAPTNGQIPPPTGGIEPGSGFGGNKPLTAARAVGVLGGSKIPNPFGSTILSSAGTAGAISLQSLLEDLANLGRVPSQLKSGQSIPDIVGEQATRDVGQIKRLGKETFTSAKQGLLADLFMAALSPSRIFKNRDFVANLSKGLTPEKTEAALKSIQPPAGMKEQLESLLKEAGKTLKLGSRAGKKTKVPTEEIFKFLETTNKVRGNPLQELLAEGLRTAGKEASPLASGLNRYGGKVASIYSKMGKALPYAAAGAGGGIPATYLLNKLLGRE